MNESIQLTFSMMVILALLLFTVFIFVTEWVRVDVTAVIVMVALGVLTLVPGLEQIVNPTELFAGFSSNAVVSIIAVSGNPL